MKSHTYFSKQVSDCLFTTLHTRALFYTKNQRLLPTGIYHTTNGLILKMGKTKVLPTLGAVHKRRRTFLGGEGVLKLRYGTMWGEGGHRKYDVGLFLH